MNRSYSPRRVVSLQPSATVILQAIGQLDCVVACTRYCVDVCPEVGTGQTIVDDSWTADATEIIAAKPDLVIAAVPYQEKSIAEILKSGARFLGLAPKMLADIYTDIVAIAGIVGVPKRGEEVVSAMQAEIDRIHAQAAGLPEYDADVLEDLYRALLDHDQATFGARYGRAADQANEYHVATGHPYIRWTLPSEPPEKGLDLTGGATSD